MTSYELKQQKALNEIIYILPFESTYYGLSIALSTFMKIIKNKNNKQQIKIKRNNKCIIIGFIGRAMYSNQYCISETDKILI
jgi:pantothenate kinase